MGAFQYGVAGVDLFFTISGVVISAVTVGKFHDARKAITFLYHRFARIYPVLWVYSLIVLVAYLYNPRWINGGAGHRVDIVSSFLLLPAHSSLLIMQGWTLSYEVYFYLVFFALLFSTEHMAPWLLLLWGGAIVTFATFGRPPVSPVVMLIGNPETLEFLGGCLLFHLYRRSKLHPASGIVLVAVSFLWLATVMVLTHRDHGANANWIEVSPFRCVLFGGFALLFLSGVMELERGESHPVSLPPPLTAVGELVLFHLSFSHHRDRITGRTIHRFASHLPFGILFVDALALPAF